MNKIAPVLLVFGQSNAHASGVKLGEEEKIRVPLKHVKTLPRIPNQAFSPAPVVWEGYVSAGTNLGETQDDTACPSEPRGWLRAICGTRTIRGG